MGRMNLIWHNELEVIKIQSWKFQVRDLMGDCQGSDYNWKAKTRKVQLRGIGLSSLGTASGKHTNNLDTVLTTFKSIGPYTSSATRALPSFSICKDTSLWSVLLSIQAIVCFLLHATTIPLPQPHTYSTLKWKWKWSRSVMSDSLQPHAL